ncbi:hypothetical protein B0H63DRAFT_19465 [Podospora didyma]|uniref:NACHT-NTPase and P-loop NTPases N-terminal domain-containing protein n=1 Tax=Podospora didyma TaxID=330526 RepID=A0AAE0U7B1_9PEZI|nr:hypothetical protein B0H63DRAFT_19465 [Podospora didyma]
MATIFSEAYKAVNRILRTVKNLLDQQENIEKASKGLPKAFACIANMFPVAKSILDGVVRRFEELKNSGDSKSPANDKEYDLVKVRFEEAIPAADLLLDILEAVLPEDGDRSAAQRYKDAASQSERDAAVEKLMLVVLKALNAVAGSSLQLLGEKEKEELQAAITVVEKLPPSLAAEPTGTVSFNHHGSGIMNNHTGYGDVYVHSGQAPQMGGRFNAPIYIGTPPPTSTPTPPLPPTKKSGWRNSLPG